MLEDGRQFCWTSPSEGGRVSRGVKQMAIQRVGIILHEASLFLCVYRGGTEAVTIFYGKSRHPLVSCNSKEGGAHGF